MRRFKDALLMGSPFITVLSNANTIIGLLVMFIQWADEMMESECVIMEIKMESDRGK